MKYIIAFILLVTANLAFAQMELPKYPEANKIAATKIPVYKEALFTNLVLNGLNNCNTDKFNGTNMGDYLAGSAAVLAESIYLFPGEQPLLVILAKGYNWFQLEFKTTADLKQITAVNLTIYNVVTRRVNIGTLADPVMIDREVVTIDNEGQCYKSLPAK